MRFDMDLALKADKLAKTGLHGRDLGLKLKVNAPEANRLAHVGWMERQRQDKRLTVPEMELIRALAGCHEHLLRHGETRSPKTGDVSRWAGRSPGWAASTAQKRIFDEKWDESVGMTVEGLGFVHVAGNGYIWLTDAGWALAHAMGVTS